MFQARYRILALLFTYLNHHKREADEDQPPQESVHQHNQIALINVWVGCDQLLSFA